MGTAKSTSLEQILIVLWPGFFPALMAYRDRRNIYNYIFLGLFTAQWLLYVLIINDILVGIFAANFIMFVLLVLEPYWALDIDKCFRPNIRDFLKSKPVYILLTTTFFYSMPALVAEVALISSVMFTPGPRTLFEHELAAKYLHWTPWHLGIAWLLIIGWNVFQVKSDKQYAFIDYFFNRDMCGEGAVQYNAFVAVYAILTYIFMIAYTTVRGITLGVSMIHL